MDVKVYPDRIPGEGPLQWWRRNLNNFHLYFEMKGIYEVGNAEGLYPAVTEELGWNKQLIGASQVNSPKKMQLTYDQFFAELHDAVRESKIELDQWNFMLNLLFYAPQDNQDEIVNWETCSLGWDIYQILRKRGFSHEDVTT